MAAARRQRSFERRRPSGDASSSADAPAVENADTGSALAAAGRAEENEPAAVAAAACEAPVCCRSHAVAGSESGVGDATACAARPSAAEGLELALRSVELHESTRETRRGSDGDVTLADEKEWSATDWLTTLSRQIMELLAEALTRPLQVSVPCVTR